MPLLALDDTDGRDGGCTTHLAFQVLLALPELALTGMPRLVRLNPNVPWKTRGNGAVLLPLGVPRGPSVRVGELRGLEILAFPDAAPAAATTDVLERVWQVVRQAAQPGAQPAVALANEPAPAAAYWQAVRTLVPPEEARPALDASDILHRETEGGRALAGCLGALAWPGPASSYEFIAYRHPSRWGTPRAVSPEPLLGLDATGATFHTSDPEEGRVACVPHGPDPVLLGLRGRDPEALLAAATRNLPFAAQEPIDGWLLWATNQASGDHVTPIDNVAETPELATIRVAGTVQALPETRAGGHAFVALTDRDGIRFQAAAFEPTKGLRETVRRLRPGDEVVAVGAWKDGVVNLEKLQVVTRAPYKVKAANPRCPTCGKGMKSAGQGQG
ncbi:MAG: tRNA(Ile)(2)-agmatinylcytidine synthase, partial [Halobacteriales archaeon]|nr:tRNA(Ile)(2)-agmatinylcytidine synthase [Halobacteriales archaeon]